MLCVPFRTQFQSPFEEVCSAWDPILDHAVHIPIKRRQDAFQLSQGCHSLTSTHSLLKTHQVHPGMLLRAQEKFVKNTENMLKNILPSHTNTTVVPSPMNAGQKQARVAEPVSATRGSQSALHCGLPGFEPSLSKNRRVASSPYTRVGCEDIRARVLLAICNHPSQIFQSDFLSCKRQII